MSDEIDYSRVYYIENPMRGKCRYSFPWSSKRDYKILLQKGTCSRTSRIFLHATLRLTSRTVKSRDSKASFDVDTERDESGLMTSDL